MKKFLISLMIFMFTVSLSGCHLFKNSNDDKDVLGDNKAKITVHVTNYPLYFFATKIANNKINIQSLIPPGAEPHSWEPTPRDMISLEKTQVLIYNGAGLEEWIVNVCQALKNKELQIVDASKGIELIHSEAGHGHDHDNQKHQGTEFDPHIWLDPLNSIKMVSNILETFIAGDPQNEDFFRANAKELVEQLEYLDETYNLELSNSKKKVFVVNHAAFGYLAHRYGLNQKAIMGLNPHIEPTPQKVVTLVNLLKEHDLKYIFTETLVSSKVAEVLAAEAGISTKVLNPLGNLTREDLEAGKDFFSIMYENLAALKEGLN